MKGIYAMALLVLASLACMESAAVGAGLGASSSPTVAVSAVWATPAEDEMIVESAGLPSSEYGFITREVCYAQTLNVRSGPGTNFPVVGVLEFGERVRVRDVGSGYGAGWLMVSRLDYVPPYSPQWVRGSYLCVEVE